MEKAPRFAFSELMLREGSPSEEASQAIHSNPILRRGLPAQDLLPFSSTASFVCIFVRSGP